MWLDWANIADSAGLNEGHTGLIGAFMFGLNLSSFGGHTEQLLNSGQNSTSQLLFIEMYLDGLVQNDQRFFSFANYDVMYCLSPDGLLTVRT